MMQGSFELERSRPTVGLVSLIALAVMMLVAAASATAAPGDPDLSFNGTGERTFQPRGLAEPSVSDVLVQPDGKILVLGSTGSNHGSDHDMVVLRLAPDGSPDTTFGLGGVATIDFSKESTNADDYAGTMALQSNGKIVVVGTSYIGGGGTESEHATVARLDADGELDTTFGIGTADGWVPGELKINLGVGGSGGTCCSFGDSANAVVVRPDDRMVVVGESEQEYGAEPEGNFFALGLTADGHRDASFGDGGRAFVDFGNADDALTAGLTSNGDLIMGGTSETGSSSNYAVARLSSAGAPVAAFGSGGKLLLSGIGSGGTLTDLAIQPDGKLAFAATEYNPSVGNQAAGLIRLDADGSTDSVGGQSFQPISATTAGTYPYAGSIAIDSEGRLLVSEIDYGSEGRISFGLARFTAAGAPDPTFGSGGVVTIPIGESISGHGYGTPYLALQGDGRIVLAGTAAGLFDVRRFLGGDPEAPPSTGASGSAAPTSGAPPASGTKPKPPTIKALKAAVSAKKRRASFTFSAAGTASGFQCALVKPTKKKHAPKPSFSACRSPKTYKGLAAGKYTFEVRAVGSGGTGAADSKRFTIG
jgi:uncharacterized delta-60 repeat protein